MPTVAAAQTDTHSLDAHAGRRHSTTRRTPAWRQPASNTESLWGHSRVKSPGNRQIRPGHDRSIHGCDARPRTAEESRSRAAPQSVRPVTCSFFYSRSRCFSRHAGPHHPAATSPNERRSKIAGTANRGRGWRGVDRDIRREAPYKVGGFHVDYVSGYFTLLFCEYQCDFVWAHPPCSHSFVLGCSGARVLGCSGARVLGCSGAETNVCSSLCIVDRCDSTSVYY